MLSRVSLYMENYQGAIDAADNALDISGITSLAYTDASYKALYNGGTSNKESFFTLAINSSDNWSANSSGNIWSSYNFSPNPYLQSLYGAKDVRRSIILWSEESTPTLPIYGGGKLGAYGIGGNPAIATEYLINAPEMFLTRRKLI